MKRWNAFKGQKGSHVMCATDLITSLRHLVFCKTEHRWAMQLAAFLNCNGYCIVVMDLFVIIGTRYEGKQAGSLKVLL